jgi:hypothetical protein
MQQWHGFKWEFSELSDSCNFMDLTLAITADKIHSTLFERELNLYLYIPPHSSHPKGMMSGLIHGNVLRIHCLCSNPQDITIKTRDFFNRGYTALQLKQFSIEPL